MGVSSFGNPRIEAYLQLPAAYRSLSRPSSAPDAKAFTLCSCSLELPHDLMVVFDLSINFGSHISLELLEFLNMVFRSNKGFFPSCFDLTPPFGEIVFTLDWKDLFLVASIA